MTAAGIAGWTLAIITIGTLWRLTQAIHWLLNRPRKHADTREETR